MSATGLLDMARWFAPESETTEIGLRSCEKVHEDLFHADESICAAQSGDDFVIVPERHPYGTKGGCYTSDRAPRLTRDQFLAMLQEAESYE